MGLFTRIKNILNKRIYMPASLCLIAAAGAVSYVFSPPNKNTETNGTDSAFSSDDVVFDYENATDEEINQHNVSLEEGLYSQISSTGLDSDSIDSIMNDPALTPAEKYLRLSELAAINNVDIIDKEQFSNLLPKLKNLSLEIQDNNLSNTVDSFQNLTDQQLKEANHQIKSTVDSLTIALSDPEIATVKSLELFANDIVTSSIDEDYFENEETFAETYMLLASESNNVISSAKLSLNENTSMC
jgi:predicted DNA binding CopG/RHH family protein